MVWKPTRKVDMTDFRQQAKKDHPQCKTCAMPDDLQNALEKMYTEGQFGYTQISNTLRAEYSVEISPDALSNHLKNHLPQALLGIVMPATDKLNIPKGYESGYEYDEETGKGTATTHRPEGELVTDWSQILEKDLGMDPKAFRVVGLNRASVWDQRAWDKNKEEFVLTKLKAYKLNIEKISTANKADSSISDLENIAMDVVPTKVVDTTGEFAFVFASGDLQLGKPDGDGLEGIQRRYRDSLQKAVNKAEELKGSIGTILISWVGDCIEGNVSQAGKNAGRNEVTVTMQVRILRRLMMETVKAFAPLTNDLRVVSVPGNHDEAQREPVSTDPSDSWAVDALVAVSDALELNPEAFGHVDCSIVPYDEMTTTVEVSGTKIGHAHGHQWKRDKQFDWWMGQHWGGHEIGKADVLLCGHYHTGTYAQQNFKHFIQVPAFEKESTYFRHRTGLIGNPSAVSFLTKDGKLKNIDFE